VGHCLYVERRISPPPIDLDSHKIVRLLTDVRVFCRVVAGVLGYAWSVYLAIQGRELQAGLEASNPSAIGTARGFSLAFLIPALVSVIAIWAAVVAEEGILWAMSIALVVFSAVFVSGGGLFLAPVAVVHLLVIALSRPPNRIESPRPPSG
jgi:hypothetical protein